MLAAPGTRFAGASEYDRSYKWNESFKGAGYSPPGEQLRPTAGLESLQRYNVMEPPLQRKKRIEHTRESVQLAVPNTPTEDSFLLAGQKADKFAPSQAHPNYAKEAHKRRSQALAAQREEEERQRQEREQQRRQQKQQQQQRKQRQPESFDYNGVGAGGGVVANGNRVHDYAEDGEVEELQTPDAPREVKRQLTVPPARNRQRKEAAAAAAAAAAATQKTKEAADRRQHRRGQRRRGHRRHASGGDARQPLEEASVSTKELEAQLARARREARRLEAEAVMEREKLHESKQQRQQQPQAAEDSRASYERPKTPPYYYEEAAAAASDKYAVSDPNYAKKRQLGLAGGVAKPTKQTEYQTRYAAEPSSQEAQRRRRELARAAAAESREAARRSHLDAPAKAAAKVAAATATAAPRVTTEYRRQFQPKKPDARVGVGLVPPRPRGGEQKSQQPPPPKVKLPDGGGEYRPRETLNPQRMSFPLGGYGPMESEYRKAFNSAAEAAEADWQRRLKEVRELRQRAAQYRMRAHGTHFSRQHLAQVYAPNGNLDAWQPVESARSDPDAIGPDDFDDNDNDGIAEKKRRAAARPRTAPPPHPQAAWDSDADDPDAAGYESDQEDAGEVSVDDVVRRRRRARTTAAAAEPLQHRQRRRARSAGADASAADPRRLRRRLPESDTVGRYGTPRVRDQRGGGFLRHHYDRTTPSYGGVLVGRPDHDDREAEEAAAAAAAVASDPEDFAAVDEAEDIGRPLGGRKPVGRLIRESRQLLGDQRRAATASATTVERPRGGGVGRRASADALSLPPAGLPTRDVAPLVDETASHDTPVQSPRQQQQQQQQQIRRRREEPRIGGADRGGSEASFSSSQQQQQQQPSSQPQAQPPLYDAEFSDGFFSDTASLVSSSTMSLGSQTLERARQRREDFWGRK